MWITGDNNLLCLCMKLQTQADNIHRACTYWTYIFPLLIPEDECYRFLRSARNNFCYQTTPRRIQNDSYLEILQCQYKQANKDISSTLSTGLVGFCRREGGDCPFCHRIKTCPVSHTVRYTASIGSCLSVKRCRGETGSTGPALMRLGMRGPLPLLSPVCSWLSA
jgi:hypothetical protein